jgi:hypothetical protein
MDIIKYITSYTLAFVIIQIILNYVLKIPHKITGESELINEYYIDNIKSSLLLDYFLILFYIFLAYTIIYFTNTDNNTIKLYIITITSFTTSLIAITYILSQPKNDSFFSRLFYASGYRLSINDVIIVVTTYLLTTFIIDKQLTIFN